MKVTIEFNLPDECREHLQAVHASDAWACLHDLEAELRQVVKYGEGAYKSPEELAAHVRSMIGEVLYKLDE